MCANTGNKSEKRKERGEENGGIGEMELSYQKLKESKLTPSGEKN